MRKQNVKTREKSSNKQTSEREGGENSINLQTQTQQTTKTRAFSFSSQSHYLPSFKQYFGSDFNNLVFSGPSSFTQLLVCAFVFV